MRTIVKTPSFRNLLDANFYPTQIGAALEELYGRNNKGFVPAVNVKETEGNYILSFMVPGFNKEDIQVELDEKSLHISGSHQVETGKEAEHYIRKEFTHQSFKRVFTMPENVDSVQLSATYENGILELNLPKRKVEKIETKRSILVR